VVSAAQMFLGAMGCLSILGSTFSLVRGGGTLLWVGLPVGLYLLIWGLGSISVAVGLGKARPWAGTAGVWIISTSLIAGWSLFAETWWILLGACALHFVLLYLVVSALAMQGLSIPKQRFLLRLSAVLLIGFFVGGWARAVARFTLLGGKTNIMPLYFSPLYGLLGAAAGLLCLYFWETWSAPAIAGALGSGVFVYALVGIVCSPRGIYPIHQPLAFEIAGWVAYGLLVGAALVVLERLGFPPLLRAFNMRLAEYQID